MLQENKHVSIAAYLGALFPGLVLQDTWCAQRRSMLCYPLPKRTSLISSYGFRCPFTTRGDKARNYVSGFRGTKDTFECISDDDDHYKVYVKEIVDDDCKTLEDEDPVTPGTKVVKTACLPERRLKLLTKGEFEGPPSIVHAALQCD